MSIGHVPPRHPLAVFDMGSNTGRAVVLSLDAYGHLQTLGDGKAPLRLAREIRTGGRLSADAIERTVEVLRDFRAIARGSGAEEIVAVATAAVRESDNAAALVERALADAGVHLDVLDGEAEARFSFLGAVRGLQIDHGLMIDIGGGSLEVSQFRNRAFLRSWTLSLGALLLSDRFLRSDPPREREMTDLREHVVDALTSAGVARLGADERLAGTGGTIRNLAKMDRHLRSYPIPRLHGYVLTRRRAQDLVDRVAGRSLSRRRAIPGLTSERADSIVGGGLAVLALAEHVGASELVVSGQGLREGLFYEAHRDGRPTPEEMRDSSVASLAGRFSTWEPERAARRIILAGRLLEALEPGAGPGIAERVRHAANLLDIGRSLDYYRRYEHTADVIVASDLAGFSHRKLALLAAVVRKAGNPGMRIGAYRPLLDRTHGTHVARAGMILALADEIEQRLTPEALGEVSCEHRKRSVVLRAPVYDPWKRKELADRFRRAFGAPLIIETPQGGRETDA